MLTLRLLCLARVRGGVSSLFSVLSVFGLFLIEDRKIFRGKICFFYITTYCRINCSQNASNSSFDERSFMMKKPPVLIPHLISQS